MRNRQIASFPKRCSMNCIPVAWRWHDCEISTSGSMEPLWWSKWREILVSKILEVDAIISDNCGWWMVTFLSPLLACFLVSDTPCLGNWNECNQETNEKFRPLYRFLGEGVGGAARDVAWGQHKDHTILYNHWRQRRLLRTQPCDRIVEMVREYQLENFLPFWFKTHSLTMIGAMTYITTMTSIMHLELDTGLRRRLEFLQYCMHLV